MKKHKLFTIVVIAAGFIGQVAAEKLPIIAYWSFDNDSGSTLTDSGPNKLDAKLKSKDQTAKVVTAKGMKGNALLLKAEPKLQYEIKDSQGLLNLKPPYTICGWIKKTGKIQSTSVFCKKGDSDHNGYDLRINWKSLNFRTGDGKKSFSMSSPYKSILDNTWYHVAVTNDGKQIVLLINGEPVEAKIYPKDVKTFNVVSTANKFSAVIGNYIGAMDAYNFVGMIDEFYLIGKVLSKDELFRLATPDDK